METSLSAFEMMLSPALDNWSEASKSYKPNGGEKQQSQAAASHGYNAPPRALGRQPDTHTNQGTGKDRQLKEPFEILLYLFLSSEG